MKFPILARKLVITAMILTTAICMSGVGRWLIHSLIRMTR